MEPDGLHGPGVAWPAKHEALAGLLEQILGGGHKALVFSQFVDHLELARGWAEEAGVPHHTLDGATPEAVRRQRIDAFQSGDGELFFISTRAGGTGLNLTAADCVIHLDPWWNPAIEDQASARAHRMGQTRPVTVYRLVMAGTVEDKIMRLHTSKRALADELLAGTEEVRPLDVAAMMELIREA